jgi:hypothetical protein
VCRDAQRSTDKHDAFRPSVLSAQGTRQVQLENGRERCGLGGKRLAKAKAKRD